MTQATEQEPNNTPETANPVNLPAEISGTLDKPGDEDCFKFHVAAKQAVTPGNRRPPGRLAGGRAADAASNAKGDVIETNNGPAVGVSAVNNVTTTSRRSPTPGLARRRGEDHEGTGAGRLRRQRPRPHLVRRPRLRLPAVRLAARRPAAGLLRPLPPRRPAPAPRRQHQILVRGQAHRRLQGRRHRHARRAPGRRHRRSRSRWANRPAASSPSPPPPTRPSAPSRSSSRRRACSGSQQAVRYATPELNDRTVQQAYLTVLEPAPFTIDAVALLKPEQIQQYGGEVAALARKLGDDDAAARSRPGRVGEARRERRGVGAAGSRIRHVRRRRDADEAARRLRPRRRQQPREGHLHGRRPHRREGHRRHPAGSPARCVAARPKAPAAAPNGNFVLNTARSHRRPQRREGRRPRRSR